VRRVGTVERAAAPLAESASARRYSRCGRPRTRAERPGMVSVLPTDSGVDAHSYEYAAAPESYVSRTAVDGAMSGLRLGPAVLGGARAPPPSRSWTGQCPGPDAGRTRGHRCMCFAMRPLVCPPVKSETPSLMSFISPVRGSTHGRCRFRCSPWQRHRAGRAWPGWSPCRAGNASG